jgi:uncharacterized membrane protein YozB (DUF420 family)
MKRLLWVLAFFLTVLLAGNALSYLNFDPTYSFLRLKQAAVATGWYLPAYYSHVLVGGVILVAGLFQLHPKSNQKFKRTHRFLGYVYVMGILFFAAPGGLVMSLFIQRGPWVLTSFLLQASLWFIFTALAFNRIRKKDIAGHRRWMIRSYALTFAAVTLRIYVLISSFHYSLNVPEAYATIAWLSWVPNLLIAELVIHQTIPARHSTPHPSHTQHTN